MLLLACVPCSYRNLNKPVYCVLLSDCLCLIVFLNDLIMVFFNVRMFKEVHVDCYVVIPPGGKLKCCYEW